MKKLSTLRARPQLATLAVAGLLTLGLALGSGAASAGTRAGAPAAKVNKVSFSLSPNPAFLNCVQANGKTAKAAVTVERGGQSDRLTMTLSGFKPHLAFDMFTVQNSNLLANGQPDPNFTNFGLAWYQSDVKIDSNGNGHLVIRTILLDQIFGFDPVVSLAPVNTFHVGFWFNDPADAQPCGFNGPPTPFNGEHNAGPVAFITRPDAQNDLGPLCTDPEGPGVCNP